MIVKRKLRVVISSCLRVENRHGVPLVIHPFVFCLLAFILLCCQCNDSKSADSQDASLEIFAKKEIRVAIEHNSSSYFIYRGAPMGYHYELLHRFAQQYGLTPRYLTCKTPQEALQMLQRGDCDMIAMHLSITGERVKQARFTTPLREVHQVLVQRKPDNWRTLSAEAVETQLIRQPLQLAGKTVTIPENSSFVARLKNIMDEIGDTVYISEVGQTEEELFDAVAKGLIDYTVCDDADATLNGRYFPNIDSKTPISFKQNVAWAVNLNAVALCDSLNHFFDGFMNSSDAVALYNKYYRYPIACRMARATQHSQGEGCITLWDETLKDACQKYGFDWFLVASLMYQESKFDTEACGQGTYGLMQMIPETMEQYGVDLLSTPEEHIVAGVRYLASLEKIFAGSVPDPFERMRFVVAAYNSGPGHILDAQRLAQKAGGNPAEWNDVAQKLLEKTNPDVYRSNDDVRHGYCNGPLTINYVNEIFERYEHYQTIFLH
ncbi:MAG: transporter substrate-binding domain-containing protein [Bacteroidales bacterium]|nr:transporter substrate-binding domain-containing protein [Bacteroidales bacterium]